MAKKLSTLGVLVLLRYSVVLGQGKEAKAHQPGETVSVSQEVAEEIESLGFGTVVAPEVQLQVEQTPATLQAPLEVDTGLNDPQLPLEPAK